MAEPLDYENPIRQLRTDDPSRDTSRDPLAAVPIEFDTSIVKTDDHAAVTAILAAMARAGIECFRADDRAIAGRPVELFVRAADATTAKLIAGEVFARRQKLKSYPRQTPIDVPHSDDLPEEDFYQDSD